MRQSARWILTYLIAFLLVSAVYVGAIVASQYVFWSYSLAVGLVLTLILAALFGPLLALVRRLVDRLIPGAAHGLDRTVREYSQQIGSLVDVEHLAEAASTLLCEVMHSERAVLFLVHPQSEDDAAGHRLESAGLVDGRALRGTLGPDDPMARFLAQERRPLTQHDVDLLPCMEGTSPDERTWLSDLGLSVYVPVHANEEWIGLLALGPKTTGARYSHEDVELLSTLANQTARPLANARRTADLERARAGLESKYAELERAHADLVAAHERLQGVDRDRSGFIDAIAHRLRVPFTNLDFSLQLMERYGTEAWTADQRDQLAQIKEGVSRAKQMADNLVVFATFLSSGGALQVEELDFPVLIASSLETLRPLVEDRRLALQTTLSDDLPTVWGDAERLGDAIHHLLHNAFRFTDPGREVHVRCWAEPSTLCFEAQDAGRGVPLDALGALWLGQARSADPVQRGDEGLGLGLPFVRLVIRAHGGEVYATSDMGVGSTFGFRLPTTGEGVTQVPEQAPNQVDDGTTPHDPSTPSERSSQ